ncbi:TIGR04219 family outer membrane beta-barrel protein [Thalassotalea sp. PLHSN55]|uniref:TIGR04219 family outer membrane beta-barrel protein n=1 Tax=Thalassotalea sp. PLHSN55 TaxID=3435888 RepID=UPI003F82CD2E
MKKAVIAAGVAAMMSASVQADVLGLYIGGQYWDNEATGVFGDGPNADDQEDFGLQGESQSSFHIAFEHPIPIIPNIKIASTTLDTTGNAVIDTDFGFGDTVTGEVDSVFDVNYVDYTFYYEVFSNDLLAFDFGLTGRDISGDIVITETANPGNSTDTDFSAIIPMLYVKTVIGLPFTGFNVFAEGNIVSYDDSKLQDYQVGIAYELLDNLAIDLDIQLGYRSVDMELSDIDDFYSDIKFDGVFLGAIAHF